MIVKYLSMGESRGNFWKAFPLQRKKKVSIRPIAERQVLSAEMVADCTVSGKSTILNNKEALVHEEVRRNQTIVKCFANTAYEDHGTFVSLSRIFKFESLKAHDVSKSHKTNISKFYATCANQGGQLQKKLWRHSTKPRSTKCAWCSTNVTHRLRMLDQASLQTTMYLTLSWFLYKPLILRAFGSLCVRYSKLPKHS